MATLLGQKINATYDSLLKTEDNDGITGSLKQITDGVGQTTPLYLSTTEAKIGGNLEITGDLTVGGTTTYVNTDNVTVKDGLVLLANDNVADIIDIGLYGKYNDGTVKYTGLYRDATDGVFKIFDGLATEPTTTVGGGNLADFAAAGGSYSGNLIVDGNYYSTDGAISLTNGDIVTGGHIAINSGNAPTSFSSNANQLIVGGADSGTNQGMTIASDSGATGNIFFADGITGDQQYRGLITYNHTNDTMYLGASATNKVTITSDGLSVLTGGKIFVNGAGNNGYINSKGAVAVQVASIDDSRLFRGLDSSVQEVFYVQGTGDVYASGNVGIGGTPATKLDVFSSGSALRLNSLDANGSYAIFANNGTAKGYMGSAYHLLSAPSNIATDLAIRAEENLIFAAGGSSEKMRIDSSALTTLTLSTAWESGLRLKTSGGTTYLRLDQHSNTAESRISIKHNYGRNSGGWYADDTGVGISSVSFNDGVITLDTAAAGSTVPTERMRIDSSGRVGIGTDSIAGMLHIKKASDTADLKLESSGGSGRIYTFRSQTDGDFTIFDSSGGGERMRIDSSGNVLIGGQNSNSKLTIEGARNEAIITLRSTSNDSSWVTGDRIGGIDFYSEDASGAGAGIKASISYQSVSSTSATNAMVFKVANTSAGTNNVEAMRIDSSGQTTISSGTENVVLQLTSTDANSFISFKDNTTATHGRVVVGALGEDLGLFTGGSEKMRIDSSGNVGIGVVPKTGGTTWQHVQFGGTGNLIARFSDTTVDSTFANNYYVNSSNVDSYITTGAAARMYINDDVISFSNAPSGTADTAISFVERMRIDSSGSLFFPYLGASAIGLYDLQLLASNEMVIITSSRRYKENIQDLPSTLDNILALRPVTFDEKSTGINTTGLIAEEVYEVLPELVPLKEVEGYDEPQPEAVSYSRLPTYLIKAIQEQQEIINKLEARIAALEAK